MAQYERVPQYVAATPQEVATARELLKAQRANPAFALQQGFRRSALQAKLNSGFRLTAMEYVEFSDVIPQNYVPRLGDSGFGRYEEAQKKAQSAFAERERKRIAAPRPLTQREAQAYLSPKAYNKWIDEHQEVLAKTVL